MSLVGLFWGTAIVRYPLVDFDEPLTKGCVTMARYHLTKEGPKVCSARKKCPLQEADPDVQHFPNKADAMEAHAIAEAKRHEDHDDTMSKRPAQEVPQVDTTVDKGPAESMFLEKERAEQRSMQRLAQTLKKAGVNLDQVNEEYYTDGEFFLDEARNGGLSLEEEDFYYDALDEDDDYPPVRYTGDVVVNPRVVTKRFFQRFSNTDPNSLEGKAGVNAIRKILDKHGVFDEMNYAPSVRRHSGEDDELVGMEFYGDMNAVLSELKALTQD